MAGAALQLYSRDMPLLAKNKIRESHSPLRERVARRDSGETGEGYLSANPAVF